MRYVIDLKDVQSKEDFHDRIEEGFDCPDYYGRNLDALYDVLTDEVEDVEIYFTNAADMAENMDKYYDAFVEMCEEVQQDYENITIVIE